MAHLRAVPDPDDDSRADTWVEPGASPGDQAQGGPAVEQVEPVEPVDPAAAVAPGEDDPPRDEPEPFEDEVRRYPSTIGGAFYLSILAAAGVALIIAARGDWRLGVKVLGGSLLIAALLRLVLANRDAGMLAVRNRFLDVLLLGGAGAALIALAASIPDMPVP